MTHIDIAATERANASYRERDLLSRRLHAVRRGLGYSRTEWQKNFHFKLVKHLRREVKRRECCV